MNWNHADIRGLSFRSRNLTGASFFNSSAGLKPLFAGLFTSVSFLCSALSAIALQFGSATVSSDFSSKPVYSATSLVLLSIFFVATIFRGIAASTILSTFVTILVILFSFVISALTGIKLESATVAGQMLTGSVAGVITIVVFSLSILAISISGAIAIIATRIWAVLGVVVSAIISAKAAAFIHTSSTEAVISTTFSIIAIFIGAYIALKSVARGKASNLYQLSVVLTTIKGTSFQYANLTEANFAQATLKNTDFRNSNLTRACWSNAKELEFARLDDTYLADSKIRQLVVALNGQNQNFDGLNLEGVNLNEANLNEASFVGANLNYASLQSADLRDSVLLRANFTEANLSRADLTGACIKDWSFNDQTCLTDVVCDYVYREYENGHPCDRYPCDRTFKPGEFESLFQKLTNAVELVFQDQIDWRALSFTFEKFRIEDDGMGLELKGIEQRGDYWIVKVAHGGGVSKQLVEQQVHSTYDDLRALMESKDRQINQLLGIVDNQTKAMHQQAEALTNFSNHPLGNSFFITGSTITNLAGSGQIDYHEAADQVRSLVTNSADPGQVIPILQSLFMQLSQQKVATTTGTQLEFIQQLILAEAAKNQAFKQFLIQHEAQIISAMPSDAIATAIQSAIQTVNSKLP